MDIDFPGIQKRAYPKHYIEMTFSLEPNLPQTEFFLTDSQESGANSITAIILGTSDTKENLHAAVSGLRFESVDCVRWQLSFREKPVANKTIVLL